MSGNERNEKSVLISLDSLTAANPNQGGAEGGARDESGLLDLGALTSAGLVEPAGGEADSPASPGFTPASAIQVAAPRSFNPIVVVAMVVGALGLVAAGVLVGMKVLDDRRAEPAAVTPASVASATPATKPASGGVTPGSASAPGSVAAGSTPASGVASTPGSAVASASGSAAASAPASVASAKKPKTPKTPRKPAARRPAIRKPVTAARSGKAPAGKAPASEAVAAKPPAKPKAPAKADEVDDMLGALNGKKSTGSSVASPAAESADPLLPKKLSRQQIIGVVRRNATAVRGCKAQEPKTGGTVMVELVIKGSGSVDTAKVISAQKGTPMGNCVQRKVKVFRFAQFNGPPMRIKMPFAL